MILEQHGDHRKGVNDINIILTQIPLRQQRVNNYARDVNVDEAAREPLDECLHEVEEE